MWNVIAIATLVYEIWLWTEIHTHTHTHTHAQTLGSSYVNICKLSTCSLKRKPGGWGVYIYRIKQACPSEVNLNAAPVCVPSRCVRATGLWRRAPDRPWTDNGPTDLTPCAPPLHTHWRRRSSFLSLFSFAGYSLGGRGGLRSTLLSPLDRALKIKYIILPHPPPHTHMHIHTLPPFLLSILWRKDSFSLLLYPVDAPGQTENRFTLVEEITIYAWYRHRQIWAPISVGMIPPRWPCG